MSHQIIASNHCGRAYLIDVFGKNVREALTKAEKNAVHAMARHFEEES